MTYRTALSNFDRRVWLFLAAWGLIAFAYFGVIGVLLNLYLLRLGFDVAFIGLLIGSGQLIWAISAFPSAAVGPRIGQHRAIVIGMATSAAGMALLLLVEALPASARPAWLIFCWGLVWFGAALFTVNSLPYLAGITRPEYRNYAFASRQTVIATFTILGSLIAGVLPGLIASRTTVALQAPAVYRMALTIVPACFAAASLLMLASPRRKVTQPSHPRKAGPLPYKLLVTFGIVAILQTASEGPLRAFFNVYMSQSHQLQAGQIGLIIAIANVFGVVATLILPRLMTRRGTAVILAGTTAVLGGALLLLGSIPTVAAGVIGFVTAFFAINGVATARAPFSQEIVEESLRPATSAILNLAVALGWGITAIAGGMAVLAMGFSGVFFISAVFAFLSAAFVMLFFIHRQARKVIAPSAA